MTSLRLTSKSNLEKPFVKISALCCFVSIRRMSMLSGWILDLNQWYLMPICFVRDVISGPLLFARFWVPTLSSQAFDTWDTLLRFMFILSPNSNNNLLADTNSRISWERAIYSASKVDNAISDCNFELQHTGTPPKFKRIHVLLLTLTGSRLSSEANRPAKSASANKSNLRLSLYGFMINPLSLVPFRYLTIYLTPTSCDALGWWENLAH